MSLANFLLIIGRQMIRTHLRKGTGHLEVDELEQKNETEGQGSWDRERERET